MFSFFTKNTTTTITNNVIKSTLRRNISTESTAPSAKLLEYKRTRDQVLNAHNDKFRISLINLTKSANTSKSKHSLTIEDTQLLGKLMSGTSMSASFLSDEERISTQIISDINPTHIYAEAIKVGEVRGFIINGDTPRLETPNQIIKRKGIFQFSKILYGQLKPIQSVVEVSDKDLTITKEFQHYFDQSEQIPTFIQLESTVKPIEDPNVIGAEESIEFNGGLLVETLPFTSTEEFDQLKQSIKHHSLSQLFVHEKKSLPEILEIITNNDPSIKIDSTTFVDFYCRCTLKTFKDKILMLGLSEVKHLEQHNHNEIKCIYCNKYHYLKDTDFKEMINHLENLKIEKENIINEIEKEQKQQQQDKDNNNKKE